MICLFIILFVYLFRSELAHLKTKTEGVKTVVKENLNKALERDQALGNIEERACETPRYL